MTTPPPDIASPTPLDPDAPAPGAGRRAALLISGVFLLLALVAFSLFAALKVTEPEKSLMGTTATADDKPDDKRDPAATPTSPTQPAPAPAAP